MDSKGIWTKRLTIVAALGGLLTFTSPNSVSSVRSLFARNYVPQVVVQQPEVAVTAENLADLYRRQGCPKHSFTSVRILSRAPDIILIDDFVNKAEADYLFKAATPIFEASKVINYEKATHDDVDFRDSWTAYLPYPSSPKTDLNIVTSCIEERASAVQGYVPLERMESLQLVKYRLARESIVDIRYHDRQHFKEHFDWFDPRDESLVEPGNRRSSFFVYLVADCVGGSTSFPKVPRPQRPEWCGAIKCQDENGGEVTYLDVQPKVGTAVFWYNLQPSGEVDYNTLHAGTPVINGTKVGMNIWTRERKFRI